MSTVTVTANGRTYEIPEICQSSGCTVQAAIAFFIEMAELDAA